MSLIDRFLPDYQFSERHETRVRCPPGELLDLIQSWEPRDRFANVAMTLRQTPARLMHALAPSRHPAPRPFSLKSFTPLGRDGDRAMAGGLIGCDDKKGGGTPAAGGAGGKSLTVGFIYEWRKGALEWN